MMLRRTLTMAAALLLAGCHKEISSLARKEAASDVSEAEFAVTLKEWPRAEDLYAKSAALCPDNGEYWLRLGIVRMKLGDRSGARKAYKAALGAFEDASDKQPANTDLVVRRVYTLVVLGRGSDARSLLTKAAAKHPDDRQIKGFIEKGTLDKMLGDPSLKDVSP